MSSQQIEETKRQIRALVAEMAQASKSDLEDVEYYQFFLDRVVQALAAVGGAIWMGGQGKPFSVGYQINLDPPLLEDTEEECQRHMRLLGQVSNGNEGHLILPNSGTSEDGSAGNPTNMLLVLAPVIADGKCEGVIEVFQRADSSPQTQKGYKRFLVNMAELFGDWLKGRKLKQFSDRHSLWAQGDHFSRQVHDTLDLRETCYTITNEGRRMIGCDRVSVAVKRGPRCKIEAVSGQDTLENRSNVVRYLGELSSKVCATGEPLWFEGSTEDLSPQIESSLDAYVDESYTKKMAILPIRRPKSQDMRANVDGRNESLLEDNQSNEIIGALICEQIETDLPRELIEPRIDLVYEHSARALSNSLSHNGLFLMPVWKMLGGLSVVTKARNLPKTLAIAGLLIVLLCVMFFVQTDFSMKADGALQPIERRDVFVEVPGTIRKLKVKNDAVVKAGAELVVLVNPDEQRLYDDVLGKLNTARTRLYNRQRSLLVQGGGYSEKDRAEASAEVDQLKEEVASLERQEKLRKMNIDKLTIRSPIAGKVLLSWSVEKSLIGRVVEPGQVLMTIANPDSEWELDLFLPEKRAGYVNAARVDEQLGPDLKVDYFLATNPGEAFEGAVKKVDPVTRLQGEDGHGVRVQVSFKPENHPNPRVGSRVTGKIHCGRRSFAFAWFHEAIEWVQTLLF